MPPESENNLRLEIGHVLFIDLVGYSKLLIEEQKQWFRQLTDIVLATAQVREATNEQLVRLLTGDGMALVFRNSAEEPAKCVLEITEALHNESELKEKPQFRHPKAARAHTLLATLDVLENNPKGALEHASLGQEGVFRDFATVMALQAGSDEAATQAALQAFIEKYARDAAFQVAVLYAQQHDPDKMFQWLQAAYANRDGALSRLFVIPFLMDYRHDRRFAIFCRKLGIENLPPKP